MKTSSPIASTLANATPMTIAVIVSVVLHAVVITTRFVNPEGFNRIFEDTPLEVILVNARTDEAPAKAQAIAQHNLLGGGDHADVTLRATSPLPTFPLDMVGDDLEDEREQLSAMQQEQMAVLAQVKQQIATLPMFDPQNPATTEEEKQQEERRQMLTKLVAEIEKRINAENARPRRKWVSPATMRGVQALYYDDLRHRIEDEGTTHFPEHNGQKLYGELIVEIIVNHDGLVVDAIIRRSSGNRVLDRRAIAIVQNAAPFGVFGRELRRFTDELSVVSRFKFAHNNMLETSVSSQAEALEAPAP